MRLKTFFLHLQKKKKKMLEPRLPRHWRSMKDDRPGGVTATATPRFSWSSPLSHAEDTRTPALEGGASGRRLCADVHLPRAEHPRPVSAVHGDRPSTRVGVRPRPRRGAPGFTDRTNGRDTWCEISSALKTWVPLRREDGSAKNVIFLFKCQHVSRRSTQKCLSTVFQY